MSRAARKRPPACPDLPPTPFATRIRKAERHLRDCFNILASLKTAPDRSILNIQPLLCETLMEQETAYQALSRKRRHLIARKRSLSPVWFVRRQRQLAAQQGALRRLILIGKSLGDAFAWFFYETTPDLLTQHARHPSSSPLATGLGGAGELEFLRKSQFFHHAFVLHHGITTILRIGDVSLIDLRSRRVIAIGELKTQPGPPGQITVQVVLTPVNRLSPNAPSTAKPQSETASPAAPLPVKIRTRLERQLQETAKKLAAAAREKTQLHIDLGRQLPIAELQHLLAGLRSGRFACTTAGPGLVLAAYRAKARSLHATLSDARSLQVKDFGDFAQRVDTLRLPESPFNALILSSLVYSSDFTPQLLHGTTPIFWWPLEIDLLRDLLFGRITLISVYNPAHLFARLETEGFRVVHFRPADDFVLERSTGRPALRLERFEYFVRLACYTLLSDDQIVQIILRTLEALGDRHKGPVKCDLEVIHRLG